jgi:hypothetical protein
VPGGEAVFEITGSGFIAALPIAEPDRAHVQLDHTLSVNAANGVLANDTDPIPANYSIPVIAEPQGIFL